MSLHLVPSLAALVALPASLLLTHGLSCVLPASRQVLCDALRELYQCMEPASAIQSNLEDIVGLYTGREERLLTDLHYKFGEQKLAKAGLELVREAVMKIDDRRDWEIGQPVREALREVFAVVDPAKATQKNTEQLMRIYQGNEHQLLYDIKHKYSEECETSPQLRVLMVQLDATIHLIYDVPKKLKVHEQIHNTVHSVLGVAQKMKAGKRMRDRARVFPIAAPNWTRTGAKYVPTFGPASTIIVFDFDLTLCSIHLYSMLRTEKAQKDLAEGSVSFYEHAWGGPKRIKALQRFCSMLARAGCTLRICSFGLQDEIQAALDMANLSAHFDRIFALQDFEALEDTPFSRTPSKMPQAKLRAMEVLWKSGRKEEMRKATVKAKHFKHMVFCDDDHSNFPDPASQHWEQWRVEAAEQETASVMESMAGMLGLSWAGKKAAEVPADRQVGTGNKATGEGAGEENVQETLEQRMHRLGLGGVLKPTKRESLEEQELRCRPTLLTYPVRKKGGLSKKDMDAILECVLGATNVARQKAEAALKDAQEEKEAKKAAKAAKKKAKKKGNKAGRGGQKAEETMRTHREKEGADAPGGFGNPFPQDSHQPPHSHQTHIGGTEPPGRREVAAGVREGHGRIARG